MAGNNGVKVPSVNGLSANTLVACRELKGGLPDELTGGLERRQANPVSDTTAAWGDPAVTLRCGVAEGSDQDQPYTINEVRWALHDNGSSRAWTTRGRKVNVVVEIPDAYVNQAELIGTLSFVLAKAPR